MLPEPCWVISIPRRFSSLAKTSLLCEHPSPSYMRSEASSNQTAEFGIRPAIALWRGWLVYAEMYPKDDTGIRAFSKPSNGCRQWRLKVTGCKGWAPGGAMMRKNERGQALLPAAVGLTVFILAAGLGIDMGYLRYEKRLQQSAADSAAIAGAAQYGYESSVCDGSVSTAAKTDSASNGFTDGSNHVTVTPSCPPSDGPHAGAN